MPGTYFPPQDMRGRPSFVTILQKIREVRHGGSCNLQALPSATVRLATSSTKLSTEMCGRPKTRSCPHVTWGTACCSVPAAPQCRCRLHSCTASCMRPHTRQSLMVRRPQVWEQQQDQVLDSSADIIRQLTEATASSGM